MWMALIGMFVRNAAAASYQQLLVGRALGGEPVRAFARADPVTVAADLPVRSLVEDVIYKHHFKMYPVVQDGQLTGYVESTDAARVSREDWDRVRVGDIAHPSNAGNTVHPDVSAKDALRVMRSSRKSRLLIAEGGRLVGIVAMKDMLDFLTFKLELEQRNS
jgi:predicted transcriptional regulator